MFWFIVFILILIVWATIHFMDASTRYKPSDIHLPQKIQFERTATRQYGLGNFALDIVTIGGHGRLKESRFEYENAYSLYASHFNQMVDAQESFNNSLNAVGEMTHNILLEFEKSRKLLKRPVQRITDITIAPKFNQTSSQIHQLRDIADEMNSTGVVLIQGTAIGGLAAVGSWTLVSMFGSASTGTAIASLSGVAAHNSILAWFGGGALAAGGGGMAAGTVALGAIVALPIVLFSSYKTHSSAKDLDIQTNRIKLQLPELVYSTNDLIKKNKAIEYELAKLQKQYEKISEVNKQIYTLLYPNGIASKVKRDFNHLFKQDFYTKDEAEGIDELLNTIQKLSELFNRNKKSELIIKLNN